MIEALERVRNEDGTFENRHKEPKSAKSRRSQRLPSLCVDVLRRHFRAVAKRHLADGRGRITENDLVFQDERRPGHAIAPNTFTTRFNRLVARLGLPPYQFHDLRRTFGVLMLEEGVGIDQVSRALGHADLRVTTSRYTGVVDSLHEDAAERLDAVLRHGRRTRNAKGARKRKQVKLSSRRLRRVHFSSGEQSSLRPRNLNRWRQILCKTYGH
jgi:integrase